jgi:hypothetical protein
MRRVGVSESSSGSSLVSLMNDFVHVGRYGLRIRREYLKRINAAKTAGIAMTIGRKHGSKRAKVGFCSIPQYYSVKALRVRNNVPKSSDTATQSASCQAASKAPETCRLKATPSLCQPQSDGVLNLFGQNFPPPDANYSMLL